MENQSMPHPLTGIDRAICEMKNKAIELRNPFFMRISKNDFWRLFKASAEYMLKKEGKNTEYNIHDGNRDSIAKLFEMTQHTYQKPGLVFVGPYGSGKTFLWRSFLQLCIIANKYEIARVPEPLFFTSQAIFKGQAKAPLEQSPKAPLIIDEIGWETKTGMDYGSEIRPTIDLLFERHERGLLTMGTSNFKLEDLSSEQLYGERLGDRLSTMFEFVVVKGRNYRKL